MLCLALIELFEGLNALHHLSGQRQVHRLVAVWFEIVALIEQLIMHMSPPPRIFILKTILF